MNGKNLLIIFVKNLIHGKVKTRLAKTIGDQAALDIYKELISITESETEKLDLTRHIYYSQEIENSLWKNDLKFLQNGEDLGEKMQNAFQNGFDQGYENIIIIGSDLPNISKEIIETGFEKLKDNDLVFGPADDGGYYLLGMSQMTHSVFENKPWSQSSLLKLTLQELNGQERSYSLLETLNDIDTYEDLIHSDFYKNNQRTQEIIELFTSTSNL